MGFNKTTSGTEYDMDVFLTPLGVEKLYNRGLVDGIKHFSIGDASTNYLVYEDLVYDYDVTSGGTYTPTQPTLGYILNLRGSIDRDKVIIKKALETNVKSLSSPIWRSPTPDVVGEFLTGYKLYDGNKIFDVPIVLGGRNMWHDDLSDSINDGEGFLTYLPPDVEYTDYIDINTIGVITTGSTDDVPYPGVSVNDGRRSYTEIQYFHYLNKTNKHIFFDTFNVENILPVSHIVSSTEVDENYSSEFVKQSSYLEWVSIKDGKKYIDSVINVFIPKSFYYNNKMILQPYEIIRFGVSFEIHQVGSVVTHWHGQNSSDQSAKEGQYEFDLTLKTKEEVGSSVIYSSTIHVITKVKDSNYNPLTYQTPLFY